MPKSVFTDAHRTLLETLIAARKESGLLQAELAERIGKDQAFISNIERGVRRVDVLEFYAIARALDRDPTELYRELADKIPDDLTI